MSNHKNIFFSREHLWPLLIVGFAVLIYGYSLSNGFVWDDNDYLVFNPSMGSPKGLVGFWTPSNAFSAFPLTASVLWLEHGLWGLIPLGYHTISLTLHILNALLLFGVVRRLAPSLAGVTALLFTIHPIQVETVAWIAEQKNLLCFFFFMLAFHSFLDLYSSCKKKDYVKMLIFFTAALMSKSIAICFATVPLLYTWRERGSLSKHDLLRTIPLFFIGALSTLIPLYNESMESGSDLLGISLFEKILLAGKNFFFYIKQIALPWRFLTLYPKWDLHVDRWKDWLFPAGVVAAYFILYRYRRRLGRGAFALFCFYGISIFPVLGFFKIALLSITGAADHFSYLSIPPVLLLLCAMGRALLSKLQMPAFREFAFFKKSVALAIIFFLSAMSFRLTLNYKDNLTLFGQLLRQCPESFLANSRFGIVCLDNPKLCDTDRAVRSLEKAVRIDPGDSLTLSKLGVAYERKGLPEKAKLAYLRASVGQEPFSQSHYFFEISRIFFDQKKFQEATFFLEKSLALRNHPEYPEYHKRYLRSQRTPAPPEEEAIAPYLLGCAYFHSGNFKKAAEAFRLAIASAPEWSKSHEGLGASLINLGDVPGALKAFQEAYRLDPGGKNIKSNLEYARQRLGRS